MRFSQLSKVVGACAVMEKKRSRIRGSWCIRVFDAVLKLAGGHADGHQGSFIIRLKENDVDEFQQLFFGAAHKYYSCGGCISQSGGVFEPRDILRTRCGWVSVNFPR